MKEKAKKVAWLGLGLFVFFACIMMWKGFVRGSTFAWISQQPAFFNAVAETALFCAGYYLLMSANMKRGMKAVLIALLFLGVTYLHAFCWAALANAAYLLMLYLFGKAAARVLGVTRGDRVDIHVNLLLGMSGMIVLVAVLSIFSLAYPRNIRYLCAVMLVLELILFRKDLWKSIKTLRAPQAENEQERGGVWKALAALTLGCVTVIACRANLCLDYDTLWYGVQSQYALVPDGSIYSPIHLMGIVFSYSKGFEILGLPWADLPSYGFTVGLNVMLLFVALHALYCIGQELGLGRKSWFIVVIMAANPSMMAMGITAKPDILNQCLFAYTLLFALVFLKRGDSRYFFLTFAAGIMSYAVKAGTSLVFSTILMTILVLVALILRQPIQWRKILWALLPLAAAFCVILRTVLLTGYPFNSFFPSILKAIGYPPKYPYTFNFSVNMSSLPSLTNPDFLLQRAVRLGKLFFAPNDSGMEHIMIAWWGPLATCVMLGSLLLLLAHWRKNFSLARDHACGLYLSVNFLLLTAICIGSMLLLDNPDGNYFMIPHLMSAVMIVWQVSCLSEVWQRETAKLLIPLLAANMILLNLVSWSWSVGMTPIDPSLYGYYNHQKITVQPGIDRAQLTGVQQYMDEHPHRIVLYHTDYSTGEAALLPAEMETFADIGNWGGHLLASAEALEEYIRFAGIDGALVDYMNTESTLWTYLLDMAKRGVLRCEYADSRYMLLGVNPDGEEAQDEEAVYFLAAGLGVAPTRNLGWAKEKKGVHDDSWAGPECSMTVRSGVEGKVHLNAWIPGEPPADAQLQITINGEISQTVPFMNGQLDVVIDVSPEATVTLSLSANFTIDSTPDVRTLSYMITGLTCY